MNKLTKLSTWLTVLPSVILSVLLVLSNNGIDLSAIDGLVESLIAICGVLVAGGVVTAPDVPKNETKNETEDETEDEAEEEKTPKES